MDSVQRLVGCELRNTGGSPAGARGSKMEDNSLSCSYGLWVSETRGAFRSAPAGFAVGAVGGGGVLLVTPGWDRGEENQRMGEGQRKAFSGPDPFSVVPALEDALCTSSITGGWGGGGAQMFGLV